MNDQTAIKILHQKGMTQRLEKAVWEQTSFTGRKWAYRFLIELIENRIPREIEADLYEHWT